MEARVKGEDYVIESVGCHSQMNSRMPKVQLEVGFDRERGGVAYMWRETIPDIGRVKWNGWRLLREQDFFELVEDGGGRRPTSMAET